MSDELDSMGDAQLSEVFAVECAGWVKRLGCTHPENEPDDDVMCWYGPKRDNQTATEKRYGYVTPPTFATSADAVLPFLREPEIVDVDRMDGRLGWRIVIMDYQDLYAMAESPTFARSACIALIRAKRAAK